LAAELLRLPDLAYKAEASWQGTPKPMRWASFSVPIACWRGW